MSNVPFCIHHAHVFVSQLPRNVECECHLIYDGKISDQQCKFNTQALELFSCRVIDVECSKVRARPYGISPEFEDELLGREVIVELFVESEESFKRYLPNRTNIIADRLLIDIEDWSYAVGLSSMLSKRYNFDVRFHEQDRGILIAEGPIDRDLYKELSNKLIDLMNDGKIRGFFVASEILEDIFKEAYVVRGHYTSDGDLVLNITDTSLLKGKSHFLCRIIL